MFSRSPVVLRSFPRHRTPRIHIRRHESNTGLFRLLGDAEREILAEQRRCTEQVRSVARRVGIAVVREAAFPFSSSTFVIVVAGEFNSGKSTLINALLGSKLLPTGSLPTTDAITILSREEEEDSTHAAAGDVIHHRVAALPPDVTIVDTPGTNAVVTEHTALTLRILPYADWILFCTSADRPLAESERTLLTSLAHQCPEQILIVLNKIDVLADTGGDHGRAEKERVLQFVTQHATAALGTRPVVLPVSARDALAAKLTGRGENSPGWQRSNFAALEGFLRDTLTSGVKIRAKLSSPLGVAEGILVQCRERLQAESEDLHTDVMTLQLLQTQLTAWRKELTAEMFRATQEMQALLFREGQRAAVLRRRIEWQDFYFSYVLDTERLWREWEKTKPPNISSSTNPTQQQQSDSVKAQISWAVQEMAASVALLGRAQGQAMIEFLGHRPALRNQSLLGSVTFASQYEETRRSLQDNMMAVVNQHVDLDETQMQEALLHRWQSMIWCSAAANAAIVSLLAASAAQLIDVMSGALSVGVLGTFHAFVWYAGRQQVVDQYSSPWTNCSQRLDDDVQIICSKEIERVSRRIGDGVAPYTLFVEAEQERLLQLSDECNVLMTKARQLRKKIANIH